MFKIYEQDLRFAERDWIELLEQGVGADNAKYTAARQRRE